MKKILSLILFTLISSTAFITAFAADAFFVFDNADYLTNADIEEIDSVLTDFNSYTDHAVYLLTKHDPDNPYDTSEYTNTFIETNGLGLDGKNGFIVVLDLDKEVQAIYNFGTDSKEYFTDAFVTAFNYSLTQAYVENNYKEAFLDAIENTYSFLDSGSHSFMYNQSQNDTEIPTEDKKYIADDAGLLSVEQEAELQRLISRIAFYHDIDVAIHTTNTIGGMDIADYAGNYYDSNGFAYDGMLFVVDIGSRSYYTLTQGYAYIAFTSDRIDDLSDTVTDYLSDGEYYEAFTVYLNNVDGYLEAIHNESELSYDFDKSFGGSSPSILKREIILVAVSLIIAFIIIFILQRKMNTAVKKTQANDYLVQGSLNIIAGNDYFITSNVVRVPKQQTNSTSRSGSSGGSRGGGGGKF